MIPKCMSQMNSPEWLRTERKCTQVGTKMFTWPTTRMSRTRQESRNIERGDRERETERGKKNKGIEERGGMKGNKEEKKRRVGKTEEERK